MTCWYTNLSAINAVYYLDYSNIQHKILKVKFSLEKKNKELAARTESQKTKVDHSTEN